jgi:hypothetical protein
MFLIPFIFLNVLFMLVSRFVFFSILCILRFCIVVVLFCVLFLLLYKAVSLIFFYQLTDHCHRVETQLQ